MHFSPILDLPALEQARLVARRELSSEELVRIYLERIEVLDPQVKAFVETWPKQALATARQKDAMVKAGGPIPSFHGIPMGVKDMYFVRGRFTRFGSRSTPIWSPIDCITTRALRRGGFVLLGKTTTSEFGVMPVTEPDTHAPTRNPWDLRRTAGGSSGGAGAAVAAGLLPIAHGSDGAGSIRIPAAFGHLFGFKPSRGRVPNAFGRDDRHVMYTCGPIARTVGDAATMLDVLAGLDVGKPHWLAPPTRPYAATYRDDPGQLRIALALHNPAAPTLPAIREHVERVARLLEAQGHHVFEAKIPQVTLEEFLPIYQSLIAEAPVLRPRRIQPVTAWLRDAGRRLPPGTGRRTMERLAGLLAQLLDGADVILSPTVGVPIPAIGQWRNLAPDVAFGEAAHLGAYTAAANITGAPAASVPAGLLEGRWPVGAQLTARPGEDALVLQLAHQLEGLMPWAGMWPPLAGKPTDPRELGDHAIT